MATEHMGEQVEVGEQVEAPVFWAAVDVMHQDMAADAQWAHGLGINPNLQAQVVERLRQRSATWIADHMVILVGAKVEA